MSKILLIDDNMNVIDLLSTLLEMEGYEVVVHPLGEDFLGIIRQEKPDVILMDVYLDAYCENGDDGFELLRQIRQQESMQNTRVIMSSGIDFRIESENLGADGFIHKPYMPEELIGLIKEFST